MRIKVISTIVLIVSIITFVGSLIISKENIKEPIKEQELNLLPSTYIGQFSISHYCSCPICTGTKKGSKTYTGHIPKQGRTVAVDPKIIPLHSIIFVEDLGYFVCEDVGGGVKGNHLDIYVDEHDEALRRGVLRGAREKKVYLLKLGNT